MNESEFKNDDAAYERQLDARDKRERDDDAEPIRTVKAWARAMRLANAAHDAAEREVA